MRKVKDLVAMGDALINGKHYLYLGKNIKVAKETLEFYGKENFFEILGSKKKNTYTFILSEVAGPIPSKVKFDPDDPMFIINDKKGFKGDADYCVSTYVEFN